MRTFSCKSIWQSTPSNHILDPFCQLLGRKVVPIVKQMVNHMVDSSVVVVLKMFFAQIDRAIECFFR